MNLEELENHEYKRVRAHRLRRDGVDYKLRVIPRSGGMLELVEVEQTPNRFHEWARMMNFIGWHV